MSITLKRPMFRRGGSTNTGIMSGLVDRSEYAEGSSRIDKEQLGIDTKAILDAMQEFSPVARTRLPIGEVGLALASGVPLVDALGMGYKKFVSEDDKRRALLAKRQGAAVSTALSQQFKKPKDSRTNEMKILEELYGKDSPQYKQALEALVLKDVSPRAGFETLTKDQIKNIPGLDENKAYQRNIDPRSKDFNRIFEIGGAGTSITIGDPNQIKSQGKRDQIINDTNFVSRQLRNIEEINKILQEDPTLAGGAGLLRKYAFDTLTLGKDFNIDLTGLTKKLGGEGLLLDTDTARLEALEDILVPAFARVMNPNSKITNLMLEQAKAAINLTGLKGSEAVRVKLDEIKRQFETYISDQQALLGIGEKKFKVVNGKLVEDN